MPGTNFNLRPVTDTPFEAVAERVEWDSATTESGLMVMDNYGQWLVTTHQADGGETKVDGLVGFSIEAVEEDEVRPPRDLEDVKRRLGHKATYGNYGWFNGDMTAKGLASMMANTDTALQPRSITGPEIAVRRLEFGTDSLVYVRDERNTRAGRILRIVRHGSLFVAATIGDIAGDAMHLRSRDPGTNLAMRGMERRYGDAGLVFMPTPPIWQEQQAQQDIKPTVPPHAVLARGRQYTEQNTMRRVGAVPVQ